MNINNILNPTTNIEIEQSNHNHFQFKISSLPDQVPSKEIPQESLAIGCKQAVHWQPEHTKELLKVYQELTSNSNNRVDWYVVADCVNRTCSTKFTHINCSSKVSRIKSLEERKKLMGGFIPRKQKQAKKWEKTDKDILWSIISTFEKGKRRNYSELVNIFNNKYTKEEIQTQTHNLLHQKSKK